MIDLAIGDLLRSTAARVPDTVALVTRVTDPNARRRWTYAALLRDAERTGRALLGRFEPGERIAVWAPNLPEWVLVEFGAALAGIVLVTDPATGETLPPDTQGEICVRGWGTMLGYFDLPEATAATIDPDRWLHTSDLCTLDDRGYLRITGRLTDMIIRGGENIYPREIEAVLLDHHAVADVAVVGVPDERWGEQVAAFVRLAPSATRTTAERDLESYLAARLAAHKRPRIWRFVDEFPLTPSGKIQKYVLRADHLRGVCDE